MKTALTPRRILATTIACTFAMACDPAAQPTSPDASEPAFSRLTATAISGNPEVAGWMAQLRRVTAPFHSMEVALEAGWDVPLTGCLELPGVGGMGYHYGNGPLIDGVAEALAPEALLYEPQKNGRMRLVAVEYLVPFSFLPADGPAPSLHGVEFHRNDGAGLWVLHAWIWRDNPMGIFTDWNPNVSCAFVE